MTRRIQRLTTFDPLIVSLQTIKTELAISDNSQDVEISALIRTVTLSFASQLERIYWSEQWRETVESCAGNEIKLSLWPVKSIESVTDTSANMLGDYEILNDSTYPDRRNRVYRAEGWPEGITFEYSAGWRMADEMPEGYAVLPEDIRKAAIVQLKAWYYGGSFDIPAGVGYVEDSGGSIRFRPMESELNPAVANILRSYV